MLTRLLAPFTRRRAAARERAAEEARRDRENRIAYLEFMCDLPGARPVIPTTRVRRVR